MELSPYQIANILIILVVLVVLVRYAWGVVADKHYQPKAWRNSIKQGLVSKELQKLAK